MHNRPGTTVRGEEDYYSQNQMVSMVTVKFQVFVKFEVTDYKLTALEYTEHGQGGRMVPIADF